MLLSLEAKGNVAAQPRPGERAWNHWARRWPGRGGVEPLSVEGAGRPRSRGKVWKPGQEVETDEKVLLIYLFKFILFIYFWLCWVFVAERGLSLVAASGGYSSLRCTGFSLSWLL